LTETIENDRYPLSPRIQTLCRVLAKFGPMASTPPPSAQAAYTEGERSEQETAL
jgi:hypothetical protein